MNPTDGKQYGLILPKSKQNVPKHNQGQNVTTKSSVFGDDSSSNSDDGTSTDWLKKKLKSSTTTSTTSAGHSGGMKKQTKVKRYVRFNSSYRAGKGVIWKEPYFQTYLWNII